MDPIPFSGSPGSPYTRKMLAVLRYRRLPYRFISGDASRFGFPAPKVRLLPTFYFPDANGEFQAVTDSSPILRKLDHDYPGRSVIPDSPALAFLDHLVEDYADEWLTKAMFHYRWSYAADIRKSATVLPNWMGRPLSEGDLESLGKAFSQRQIGRLSYVGSNPVTGPVIEASYQRLLHILETHLAEAAFVFGARPGAADFGLFGQLTQLAAFDPTPTALAERIAPRVIAYVGQIEDLSGLEPTPSDWSDPDRLSPSQCALLGEIGRVYAPLLLANAEAVRSGAGRVEAEIEGALWTQNPFPYQVKCLNWLREAYGKLAPDAQRTVAKALDGTGCDTLFAGHESA